LAIKACFSQSFSLACTFFMTVFPQKSRRKRRVKSTGRRRLLQAPIWEKCILSVKNSFGLGNQVKTAGVFSQQGKWAR